jgi:hypothetical protein
MGKGVRGRLAVRSVEQHVEQWRSCNANADYSKVKTHGAYMISQGESRFCQRCTDHAKRQFVRDV